MATHAQDSDSLPSTTDRRSRGPRRRSSASTRASVRNMENFRNNRGHRFPRTDGDVSALFSHRAKNRRTAGAESEEKEQTDVEATQKEVPSQPIVRPEAFFGDWRPSIVLGTPLCLDGEDLSAIEIADRKVAQTRLWMEHYQQVPNFAQMHQDAVRERGQLDETAEDNIKPRSATRSST